MDNLLGLSSKIGGEGYITVNRGLVFSIGVNEALIYGELLSRYRYFNKTKGLQPDGSFFNTVEDLYMGTGLGKRAQKTAIDNLITLGLLEVDLRGLPRKRYFLLNPDTSIADRLIKEGEAKQNEYYKSDTPSVGAFAPTSKFVRDQQESAFVAFNNNNNKNNINKNTSPPTAEGVEEVEILDKSFLGVDTPKEVPPNKKSKPLQKKLVAGEYERINSRDIMEYFRDKYTIKYKRYPNNPSDTKKTLGILQRAFLDKYGGKLALELIDQVFELYDVIDIDRSNYPRPEYSTLTQDWLINKVLDHVKSKDSRKEEEEWTPPEGYVSWTKDWKNR
jgi:hypothetical protein